MEVEVKEAEGYKLFLAGHSNSTTGYLGVYKVGDKFRAKREVDGKQIYLGIYDTAVDAAVAYAKHVAASAGSSSSAAAAESPEPPARRRRLSK